MLTSRRATKADLAHIPKSLADLMVLGVAAQTSLMNELNKPEAEQSPLIKAWSEKIVKEFEEFTKMSPDLLPTKELQRTQRFAQRMLPRTSEIEDGYLPRELEARVRKGRDAMVKECLMGRPVLQGLQQQLETLWRESGEDDAISVPILRNAINKHLSRPKEFLTLDLYTPTPDAMAEHLIDIYERRPELHAQLLRLVMRACLFEVPRHPKPCTCLLCDYIAAVAAEKRGETVEADD